MVQFDQLYLVGIAGYCENVCFNVATRISRSGFESIDESETVIFWKSYFSLAILLYCRNNSLPW